MASVSLGLKVHPAACRGSAAWHSLCPEPPGLRQGFLGLGPFRCETPILGAVKAAMKQSSFRWSAEMKWGDLHPAWSLWVVIVTFVTYFTVSVCLSLIQPGFSGAYDDDVNILPGGKIKLTMEFY